MCAFFEQMVNLNKTKPQQSLVHTKKYYKIVNLVIHFNNCSSLGHSYIPTSTLLMDGFLN